MLAAITDPLTVALGGAKQLPNQASQWQGWCVTDLRTDGGWRRSSLVVNGDGLGSDEVALSYACEYEGQATQGAAVRSRAQLLRLHATLVHPYLCKYKDEDCVFMRNPTMSGAKGNLEGLKDIVKKAWKLEETFAPKGTKYESHGLLLIYVATHVVNITRGPNAGSYLCFADSNLSSPEAIKKTTITVKNFCKIISKVNCKEKVIFLDIAHAEKPKGGAFSTSEPKRRYFVLKGANLYYYKTWEDFASGGRATNAATPISLADYEPKAPSVDPHLNKIDLVPASAGLELARVWELQAPSTAEFAEWMLVLQEARELAQKRGGPPGIGAARTVHLADG